MLFFFMKLVLFDSFLPTFILRYFTDDNYAESCIELMLLLNILIIYPKPAKIS